MKRYPTSQTLSVEASVEDPARQQVSGAEDIIVHKAQFYLGVKPEKWVYGEKEKARMLVVSLGTKGIPAGGKGFNVDVIRREHKYIEKRTASGFWELVFEAKDTTLATLSGKTGGDGKGDVVYQLPKGGEYRFVVRGKDSRGNEIQSATTVSAWGKEYVPWRLGKPEKVELVPDKDSYKVGDTAKILVKSLVPVTKALMTLERGRVLEYKVIDLGGNASHIELPITEGMIPNLYLSVVAHVGRAADQPPLLYYGETELMIEPESKRLSVAIETDRKGEKNGPPIYRPGDDVKVRITAKDPSGRPKKAHVIVSVADESVLRLLNYQLPDLVKKFYYLRQSGVTTSSSLLSLKAGDSGKAAGKKRRIFKDTAHFEASLVTDENGEATFSFKLPDDLTTWVIEALAATESKPVAEFEKELKKSLPQAPAGQAALEANLKLTDDTFVGGSRARLMTTLPLVLRAALPRFAVWGDEFSGKIIANNRNSVPVEGRLAVEIGGDGLLTDDKPSKEIAFSIAPNEEKAFPIGIKIKSATEGLTFSAEVKDKDGNELDGLKVSVSVKDRFAPEVVATSGMTKDKEQEQIDLPKDIVKDKGGIDVSMRASLALAAAPTLKALIDFPWGCSEQRSASLIALVLARELTKNLGEAYFDAMAPMDPAEVGKAKGQGEKIAIIDKKIEGIAKDLAEKYIAWDGGVLFWPDSSKPDPFPSAQVLAAFTLAKDAGIAIDESARQKIKSYLRKWISAEDARYGWDGKAFALWALTLDGTREAIPTDNFFANTDEMTIPGWVYLLMAMKNGQLAGDRKVLVDRLLAKAEHAPRHTSWPSSGFFWSSALKNTALTALALLSDDPSNPNVPRALFFILNHKKDAYRVITQDNLWTSWFIVDYVRVMKEEETDFNAKIAAGQKVLIEKEFDEKNLLSVEQVSIPMKEIAGLRMPADVMIEKEGAGTLYYDFMLKYYLPPEVTPTREEGIIVSREYYTLDDVKDEKPLTEFKVGENYKGHITIIVPKQLNYVVIQDLLPAGFEPIDMQLATSSRASGLLAQAGVNRPDYSGEESSRKYDDVITEEDYGTDYGFTHQEVRDDAVVFSDEIVPPGVYHVRYPVRATTAGTFLMPGATAFEFYEPEVFGRSRGRTIIIEE